MQSCKSFKIRPVLVAGAVLALCGVTFAHHIAQGLSSVFGTEVMTEIVYLAKADNLGVPAYRLGTDSHTVDVSGGPQFAVSDGSGASEQVVFSDGLFADPTHADLADVAAAINDQLTLGIAQVDNGTLVLRGVQGGSQAGLTLEGGALPTLGLQPGTVQGADDIQLELSIPAHDEHADDHEGGGLQHHSYLVVISATEGVTGVGGFEVPIAIDNTTLMGLRMAQFGMFAGAVGQLDDNEDGHATFDAALLTHMYPQGLPDRLYFSYVVFNETLTKIAYVSNRFDVAIEK